MTSKVGLIIRPNIPQAFDLANKLVAFCSENKLTLFIEEESSRYYKADKVKILKAPALAKQSDLIVVLGGDGTLIRVAKYVESPAPVILGVNFGNLGFLTELTPEELFPTLERALQGKLKPGVRHMLSAKIVRDGKKIFSSQAVNDVVVQKGARDPLIEMDVAVNAEPLVRVRADGLIVSTPTGSTAYSLAAGGSIIYPLLAAMMITPICAHSLSMRPLILPLNVDLSVRVPHYEGEILLTIDGQVSEKLLPGDIVQISESPNTVRFVQSPSRSYFEILRGKLNWGIANKGDY